MTTTRPAVPITGPADLVGAVPYLLGFVPDRSVVAVALHGGSRSARLGLTGRVALPLAPGVADWRTSNHRRSVRGRRSPSVRPGSADCRAWSMHRRCSCRALGCAAGG